MATDSVVEEEEEEEDDEEDDIRQPMNRRLHHEVDESNIPEEDEDDQEDEMVQALDRDMAARHTNNLFRKGENSGSKQR